MNRKRNKIIAADLFCGAGGTSMGLIRACRKMGIDIDLLAVNHWPTAIETHTANHPNARHICARLDEIRPEDVIPGGRLHLLVASPECIHHSRARGGKPMNDQSRASAWEVLRWAERLYIENILIENVKEFREWGPLGSNSLPMKSKKGETFKAFINALESLGYNVDHNVLNAANYGDATTRERLFIIARRGRRKIIWPESTHSKRGDGTLFGDRLAWRPARDIIDWSIPSKSIFARKRPLSNSTLARIEEGLTKFGGQNVEPYLVILRQHMAAQSINEPLPTITAGGNHIALCTPQPFIANMKFSETGRALVRDLNTPLATITGASTLGLIQPTAFIVPQFGGADTRSVDLPLGTITSTSRGVGLCQPFLTHLDHTGRATGHVQSIDRPLTTITTKNRFGLVSPFLVSYYGASGPQSVDQPLPTVTTKDRFGVVEPTSYEYGIDILFRMLQPSELAAAMSFPSDFQFAGNKSEIVKQIGNAVPGYLSEALCTQILIEFQALAA